MTAEDVKFSFERYRGAASKTFKERVAAVETPDPTRVRFRLKEPWPDFLTFYSSATGAGWIVPKKYVEKVGDEGFKKLPIGAGPYRFVSFTPGVELVLEAVDQYWRKPPHVKRLVFRTIPDPSTRFAALKRGEIDISYWMTASLGEELRRTPGLTLKPVAREQFLLGLLRRPVGPEVPVARPPGAARREPRDRPAGDQPGGDARILTNDLQHDPVALRVLLAAARHSLRSGPSQAAPRGSGIPQRVRRGGLHLRRRARGHRRARGQ